MASGSGGRIVPPPVSMTITQIAVVVADMESALRSYTENLGWGPWSVFDYKPPLLHDTVVRGEKVEYRMIGAETSVDGLLPGHLADAQVRPGAGQRSRDRS